MKQFLYKTIDIDNARIRGSILRTIVYFDIFNYPLTSDEIFEYCDSKHKDFMTLKSELDFMASMGQIKKSGQYYFLGHESCLAKREHNNSFSEKLMKKALRYSKLISKFPFVRCVCVSGSLSKKSADEKADVDYFIITEKNRLWICRTMLALFKKVFLFNSHKYFCINYFVDNANLEIPDKNIYTATEIAFLIPVFHYENFFRFLASNSWVTQYYPEKRIEVYNEEKEIDGVIKKTIELIFDNRLGNFIDNACLKLNNLYKRIKFSGLSKEALNDNLRSLKGVSKHHPNSFQKRILNEYEEKIASLGSAYNLELN